MDDDDNAAGRHTAAAEDLDATTVAPPPAQAAPQLAWSLLADGETVQPSPPTNSCFSSTCARWGM